MTDEEKKQILQHYVEVIEFRVPRLLEDRIGLEAAIARKRLLPAESGLLGVSARLGPIQGDSPVGTGFAGIEGPDGAVAGFVVTDRSGPERNLVLIRHRAGPWVDDRHGAGLLLQHASAGRPIDIPSSEQLAVRLDLDQAIGDWLRRENGDRFSGGPISADALAVVQSKIRDAVRRRSREAVGEAEHVLRFLGRGHTAGERMMIDRISSDDPAAFAQAAGLGRSTEAGPTTAVLVGLIIFRERDGPTSLG